MSRPKGPVPNPNAPDPSRGYSHNAPQNSSRELEDELSQYTRQQAQHGPQYSYDYGTQYSQDHAAHGSHGANAHHPNQPAPEAYQDRYSSGSPQQQSPSQNGPHYNSDPLYRQDPVYGQDAHYGQPGNAQSHRAAEVPSWADMNQPQARPQSVQGGGHAATGYDPQGFDRYARPEQSYSQDYQPSQTVNDFAQTDRQTDNLRYAQPDAHHSQHYGQESGYGGPQLSATTPTAAPSGYDFGSFDGPQSGNSYGPDTGGPETGQQPGQVQWDGFDQHSHGSDAGDGQGYGLAVESSSGFDANGQPIMHQDGAEFEDDDYDYESVEGTGRSRTMMIAAALAGVIVVGVSGAYGYQALFGGDSVTTTPVVKGAAGPSKVKPADPGGRKFAHTDSKMMGRLGAASGQTNDPAAGARRVSTLRIGPDGTVIAPSDPTAAAASDGPRMVTGVPLGGSSTPEAASATPASVKPAPPNAPLIVNSTASSAAKPVQIAKVKPVTSAPAKPAPVAKKVVKPVQQKVAVATPKPSPAPVGPKPTGAGYVAVLASVPVSGTSRMDALKQFADMQQRYGTALRDKTPDVQRAELGEKGSYHRLIAGPPGSAQSARSVCENLKAAGYPSCWVLAY